MCFLQSCSKLAAVVVRHLPDLWHAPSEQLPALAAIADPPGRPQLIEDATLAINRIVASLVDTLK